MPQVRTKAQILEDFAGPLPEQLKTLDFIESIFSYVDTAVAINTARFAAMDSDILFFSAAGAPVDYTDGDPAATGEGTAAIGSVYVNETNGKHYVNGGTKAQPVWKLVTSAT